MELFIAAFILFVAVAGAFGWVADSRDGADWSPSDDGFRRSHRIT